LNTHAGVVVDPVRQVVREVPLHGGGPLRTGGFLKTEVGVETAKAQLHRLETRVGQAGFVEVAVGVVARVAGKVVVELILPVAVQHATELKVGATEVACVSGIAILGEDTIETAVVGLNSAAQFETEFLVRSRYFKTALGLQNDVSSVSGYCSGECLRGKCAYYCGSQQLFPHVRRTDHCLPLVC